MKRKTLAAVLSVLLILTVATVLYNNLKPQQKVESNASWAKDYQTLESIYYEADVVVRGKVLSILPSYKLQGLVVTDSNLEVEKIYSNKANININKKDLIVVNQEGGTYEDIIYESPPPVELLEKNMEYTLFLKYHLDFDKYTIVGDFPGQFKVEKGQLTNLGEDKNKILKYSEIDLEKALNK